MNFSKLVKDVLRPAGRVRFLAERAKYAIDGATILDETAGNKMLRDSLEDGRPQGIAKIGAAELDALRHYVRERNDSGYCEKWGRHSLMLYRNAGVHPRDGNMFSSFAQQYLNDLGSLSIVCTWLRWGERSITKTFAPDATYLPLKAMDPFYHVNPWSENLKGKRVLVISPFGNTIKNQYKKRKTIWAANPRILPAFDLEVLTCPLSAALAAPVDTDWQAGLDRMRGEMDLIKYDAAIVGAGAWSLPLVAHAARNGKWAIHMGGSTQVLFGIRGGRWDNHPIISTYFNADWTRPNIRERPTNYRSVESGAYW